MPPLTECPFPPLFRSSLRWTLCDGTTLKTVSSLIFRSTSLYGERASNSNHFHPPHRLAWTSHQNRTLCKKCLPLIISTMKLHSAVSVCFFLKSILFSLFTSGPQLYLHCSPVASFTFAYGSIIDSSLLLLCHLHVACLHSRQVVLFLVAPIVAIV